MIDEWSRGSGEEDGEGRENKGTREKRDAKKKEKAKDLRWGRLRVKKFNLFDWFCINCIFALFVVKLTVMAGDVGNHSIRHNTLVTSFPTVLGRYQLVPRFCDSCASMLDWFYFYIERGHHVMGRVWAKKIAPWSGWVQFRAKILCPKPLFFDQNERVIWAKIELDKKNRLKSYFCDLPKAKKSGWTRPRAKKIFPKSTKKSSRAVLIRSSFIKDGILLI